MYKNPSQLPCCRNSCLFLSALLALNLHRQFVSPSINPQIQKNDKVSSIYIHDNVSFIILSKLPLKSLKRFTCECKSWSLLFENPNFMKMFRKKFMSMRSLYHDTCLFQNIKEIQPHPQDGSTLYLLCGENKVNLTWPHDYIYTHMLDSGIKDVRCI